LARLKKPSLSNNSLSQLPFHAEIYACISIGQFRGGRMWGGKGERIGFPMQIYKRERKYKKWLG